jgi:hypothetical protein
VEGISKGTGASFGRSLFLFIHSFQSIGFHAKAQRSKGIFRCAPSVLSLLCGKQKDLIKAMIVYLTNRAKARFCSQVSSPLGRREGPKKAPEGALLFSIVSVIKILGK